MALSWKGRPVLSFCHRMAFGMVLLWLLLAQEIRSQKVLQLKYWSSPSYDWDLVYADKLRDVVVGFGHEVLHTKIVMVVENGRKLCSTADAQDHCESHCLNKNRYCAVRKPLRATDDHDGVEPTELLVESLRRMCVWEINGINIYANAFRYWNYLHAMRDSGCDRSMTQECVTAALHATTIGLGHIENCITNHGVLGKDLDQENLLFQQSITSYMKLGVTAASTERPQLFVNSNPVPSQYLNDDSTSIDLAQYLCDYWKTQDGGGVAPAACGICLACNHTQDHFVHCLTAETCLDAADVVPEVMTSAPISEGPTPMPTPPNLTFVPTTPYPVVVKPPSLSKPSDVSKPPVVSKPSDVSKPPFVTKPPFANKKPISANDKTTPSPTTATPTPQPTKTSVGLGANTQTTTDGGADNEQDNTGLIVVVVLVGIVLASMLYYVLWRLLQIYLAHAEQSKDFDLPATMEDGQTNLHDLSESAPKEDIDLSDPVMVVVPNVSEDLPPVT